MDQTQDTPDRSSFEFEGDEVSNFAAQLPAVRMDAPEAYSRGTYLTLRVVVRVKSVRLEEDRKGDLTRSHILALEECTIAETVTPQERRLAIEAADRAARSFEVDEVPGPDAAYVGDTDTDLIENGPPHAAEPEPVPEDDDTDSWDDDDDYPHGALRVELVEAS